jgi:PAS domain S-box-containing protein
MIIKKILRYFHLKKLKALMLKYDYNASDTKEIRVAKSLILIIAVSCSFCGVAWSIIYYWFLGFGLTTMLPLIFVIIVIPAIFIAHFLSNYKLLVYAQIICISLVPTLIQWSLGSIHNSGFVIGWCFLSPLVALLFFKEKYAKIWMLAFFLVVGITVIFSPTFSNNGIKVTETARILFYLMNIGAPFLIFYFASFYFINELKHQRERLFLLSVSKSVNEEMKQFFKTANTPIIGIDNKGLVNEWNLTSEKITGYTKQEVLGKNFVETYIAKEYKKIARKLLEKTLKGIETANFEVPLFTKEKEQVMILLNTNARIDTDGKIVGVLVIGQNITELVGYRNELKLKVKRRTLRLNKALEKQKELNKLKSRFISTTSHEFRTPLSAINFAAGSIKKYWRKMEPSKIKQKLKRIEDQVLHMTKLLDDILIVGQTEASKNIYNPLEINLGEFMSEIVDEVSNAIKNSHKLILIDPEELKNATIFIDEKLGRNIFINLLSNAVKFSPKADTVTIEFSSEDNYIIISVTDFGIGIPKAELSDIFKPFVRGKSVDLIQGSGLGLSIVKDAVDLIDGKIIVQRNIGNGTSFIVKIPKKPNTYYA